jgi:hypothetical protein
MVEAWLYGACGRDGRFFEAAADPTARAPTRFDPDSNWRRVTP